VENEIYDVVEKILTQGKYVAIDSVSVLGRTPLHFAAMRGNLELVKLLVSHGARLDLKDMDWNSVTHFACMSGNVDLIKYWIMKGMSFFEENFDEDNPYDLIEDEEV